MKTADEKELYELDAEMLEKVAAGTGNGEADAEDPLAVSLCMTAALNVIKVYMDARKPATFDKFYKEIYLPNSAAIDVALCTAAGVVGTGAYMICDKKHFWSKVYDALA